MRQLMFVGWRLFAMCDHCHKIESEKQRLFDAAIRLADRLKEQQRTIDRLERRAERLRAKVRQKDTLSAATYRPPYRKPML